MSAVAQARTTGPSRVSGRNVRERACSSSSGLRSAWQLGASLAFLSLSALTGSRAGRRATNPPAAAQRRRSSDAEALRREAQIEAREQAVRLRATIEAELATTAAPRWMKIEERLLATEDEIDRKLTEIEPARAGDRRPRDPR